MKDYLIAFERLVSIMDDLREKCPWDQKQTKESLRHLTIEETYELADAILNDDWNEIKGELGDLMLHLIFYSKIASEINEFSLAEMIDQVCEKLIHRHPHIYSDVKVQNEEEVKANWEKIKLKEGKKSVLGGVPKSLPALVKATRIQDKVKGVGFEWDNKEQVWEKVEEEIKEFQIEVAENNAQKMEEEFGDVLFSLINYARWVDVNPEDALEKTNKKFIKRFQWMEEKIKEENKDISTLGLEELDKYWNKSKKI